MNSVADAAVSQVARSRSKFSLQDRISLCRRCLDEVVAVADEWSRLAVASKGLPETSSLRAEDLLSGPGVVARQLQLSIQTLNSLERYGRPQLPGRVTRLASGQLSVPVFPTSGLFDSLTFMGISAAVRMQPGVELSDIHGRLVDQATNDEFGSTTAVLGAGNVSSIPATDSLNRIMFEGSRVVLKLNPVNDYLQSIFERVFAPLIESDLLQIVRGGADVGAALVQHELVDAVHVTGSGGTHDVIVWGSTNEEQTRRRKANDPVLKKRVTSELGNVSPWIITPGDYSSRQLDSQAQHVAASITNNASFNCLATKVIITWDQWPQRQRFVSLVRKHLKNTPVRPSYYPGAKQRFEKFAGVTSEVDTECLPWTLLENQSIDVRPELFEEESFVCVCAETSLSARTEVEFLSKAVEFVNHRLTGTLCASITVPTAFRKQHESTLQSGLSSLRYGTVCVNQWSGIAYGLVSPPWGAYPGATLQSVQSGIGNVHNTFLLDQIEKTVLEGPLVNFPYPIWFPNHRNSVAVATLLLRLYHQPSFMRLPALFAAALSG